MAIRKIVSRSIGTDVIAAEDLAANSVTVAELSDGAVTTAKLASGAVSSAKLDTNLNVSGTLGVGESSPLGQLHIKTEDTGVSSVSAQGDLLVLEGTETGISILNSTAGAGYINFGDSDDNDIGRIVYDHPTNSLRLFANGSQGLRLDSDGLKFNSDSAAANALDDYEEGTFTPAFSVEGGGTISASTTYRGDYTKIGRKVHIRIHAVWNDYTSAGGNFNGAFILRNLPFSYVSAGGGGEGLLARGLYWSSNNDNNNHWSSELVLHTFFNSSGSDGAYMKWISSKDARGDYLRQNNPLNNSSGNFTIEGEFTYITNS